MNALKDIDKYVNTNCVFSNKESYLFYRHLFQRLMDAYYMFPKEFANFVYLNEHFAEFLENEHDARFSLKESDTIYRLDVNYDYESEKFRFPKCLVDDDWVEKLTAYFEIKKRKDLKREIDKLESILATGPAELERLKKEFGELNNLID